MTKFRNLFYPFCMSCLIIAVNIAIVSAQEASTEPGSVIVKKCMDFKVTGDGHSDNWKNTEWINLLTQNPDNTDYRTKVKVLYSGTGIYFLFDCGDKKLTSTMKADNLNLWEEDVVEIFLWTDEDYPVYFEYELSPLNYELPIIVPNFDGTFLGWLPWKYQGDRRTQHATNAVGGKKKSGSSVSGWIAEFFIPYKLLAPLNQVPPVSGTRWRANMYRIDHDSGSVPFAWQKVSGTFHEYKKFGTFIFE
ncbi:MAG: carbohydrate-binding family 9-like protein [Bacteroidia bacterium]|nr:carbohydrate-binding family 9-like protein [Bacteroidia bacterium]